MNPGEILKKNEEFLSWREVLNTIPIHRTLIWRDIGDIYVMEHYQGGKIVPLKIDYAPQLDKMINDSKRPGQTDTEKDERIKKMGQTIADLNKKLKKLNK